MTSNNEEMEYVVLRKILWFCVQLDDVFSGSPFGEVFNKILALGADRFIELEEKYKDSYIEIEKKHGIV